MTKERTRIIISLAEDGYSAIYQGPGSKPIIELFGTNIIPTAFTARKPLRDVMQAIAALNPGKMVYDWNGREQPVIMPTVAPDELEEQLAAIREVIG